MFAEYSGNTPLSSICRGKADIWFVRHSAGCAGYGGWSRPPMRGAHKKDAAGSPLASQRDPPRHEMLGPSPKASHFTRNLGYAARVSNRLKPGGIFPGFPDEIAGFSRPRAPKSGVRVDDQDASKSIATSRAAAECVRLPTLTRSMPVAAICGRVSSETPPDASSSTPRPRRSRRATASAS